jgi:hypothetical protein
MRRDLLEQSEQFRSEARLKNIEAGQVTAGIVTVVAFALIFGVIVAHGEPCSGSTAQQVTAIARMGAQPGLMAFFCGECGMADGIWSLAPIAASDEIAPARPVTEPRTR